MDFPQFKPLRGDINHDGQVDQADLDLLRDILASNPLFEEMDDYYVQLLDGDRSGKVTYGEIITLINTIKTQIEKQQVEGTLDASGRQHIQKISDQLNALFPPS